MAANSPTDPSDFAHVISLEVEQPVEKLIADRKTLVVYVADDLPVGQQWLEPGQVADIPDVVPARVARRRTANAGGTKSLPSTSVVICTRDRPDELRRCLASFPLQSMRPGEVIVVDNASIGTATRDVVVAAGARYIREDRPGLDFARNSGALASNGEIVLYTDDDTELHPKWIENSVRAFDNQLVAAVTGLVLPATLRTEAQWIFEDQWSFGRGYDRIDYDQAFYFESRSRGCPAWIIGAGANMAFRRSIFDEIGLFDERLDVGQAGCSGDSEYWYRILAAGHICRYEPTAVIWHHHRLELDGLSSQIFHYMRGHAAALMVQFERTGDWGNLYRAFATMPYFYARRFAGRMLRGATPANRFLGQQVRGMLAGLWFYWRVPRPTSAVRRRAAKRMHA